MNTNVFVTAGYYSPTHREPIERPSPTPSSSTDEDQAGGDYDVIQDFVPIRFLENRIRTLSRTSVPHNLSRLEQHRENMTRLHAGKNWEKLNGEQLNASRTVQVRERSNTSFPVLTPFLSSLFPLLHFISNSKGIYKL